MTFLSALAAGSQQRLRRVLVYAALILASALSGFVSLGFATYALFEAWRLQYGAVNAALGLSAVYILLAGVLYLCFLRIGVSRRKAIKPSRHGGATDDVDALKATAQASDSPQTAALAMGVELAKQMTPLQLAMLAVISGFIAGRRL